MSDIKILVATHKKYEMPNDKMYLPIHVGREGKDDLGYQGDNTGDNISNKNGSYCELTGLYWAWKNLECEHIGLSHYRRYFKSSSKIKTKDENKLSQVMDSFEVEKLINKYDIILPKKRNYYIETIWSHYQHAHYIKDLEEVKRIIEQKYPQYSSSFENVMNGKKIHLYNMFIMKKEMFNEYCEWLFDILFELEQRVDISNYDNYQKRIFGFISERLFNVWLLENKLNVCERSVVNIEGVKWGKKIIDFIKRKVS